MSDDLRKELVGLNLNSPGGGRCRRQQQGTVAEVTKSMIEPFCINAHRAMLITAEGYLYTTDIANNIYDDFGFDPYKKALELGFNSFSAFLHSEHMKERIEIDSSNGILSYHVIITPDILNTIGHIQREQRTSFLNMSRRNNHPRRVTAFNEAGGISPHQFLRERMEKRELKAQMAQRFEIQSEVHNSSCSSGNHYEIEDEYFEAIDEDDELELDEINWVLSDSEEEEDDEIIFCEDEEGTSANC